MRFQRNISSLIVGLIVILQSGCEITLDPPETEFFLTRTWKLSAVKNGEISETVPGIENFRVTVVEDGTLKLIDFDGSEYDGEWQLNSTNSVIETRYFNYPDPDTGTVVAEKVYRWTIISIELRSLRLNQELGDNKSGKYTRTYFFEAVPQ